MQGPKKKLHSYSRWQIKDLKKKYIHMFKKITLYALDFVSGLEGVRIVLLKKYVVVLGF